MSVCSLLSPLSHVFSTSLLASLFHCLIFINVLVISIFLLFFFANFSLKPLTFFLIYMWGFFLYDKCKPLMGICSLSLALKGRGGRRIGARFRRRGLSRAWGVECAASKPPVSYPFYSSEPGVGLRLGTELGRVKSSGKGKWNEGGGKVQEEQNEKSRHRGQSPREPC